jgi:hypothetical protein
MFKKKDKQMKKYLWNLGRVLTLQEWKRNETKVAEEYCWAITQAAVKSCCSRLVASVLEFGFELDSLVYAYIVDDVYTEFRLAQNYGSSGM